MQFSEQQDPDVLPTDHEFPGQDVEANNIDDTDPSSQESSSESDSDDRQPLTEAENRDSRRLADEMLARFKFFRENVSDITLCVGKGDGEKKIGLIDAIARLATPDEITHRIHRKNFAGLLGTALLADHSINPIYSSFMTKSCASVIKRMNFLVKAKKMSSSDRKGILKELTEDIEGCSIADLKTSVTRVGSWTKILKYLHVVQHIMMACKLTSPKYTMRNGSEKAKIQSIKKFAKLGKLGKTLKVVERKDTMGPTEAEFLSSFSSLHPKREDSLRNWTAGIHIEAEDADRMNTPVTEEELDLVLSKCDRNSAPGYDGTSFYALRAVLSEENLNLRSLFREAMTNMLIRSFNNDLHMEIRKMWSTTALTMIPKGNNSFRPIGITSSFARILQRLSKKRIESKIAKALMPHQYAIGTKDGMSIVAGLAQQGFKHGTVSTFDARNAFNLIKREKVFEGLKQMAPECIGIFKLFYGNPNMVYTGRGQFVGHIYTGVIQGDALAMLFYCVAIAPLLTEIQSYLTDKVDSKSVPLDSPESINSFVYAYADDMVINTREREGLLEGERKDIYAIAESHGFFMNMEKEITIKDLEGTDRERRKTNGAIIVGIPVGTPEYIVTKCVEKAKTSSAIMREPEAGSKNYLSMSNLLTKQQQFAIVKSCLSTRLNHLYRVLDPTLTEEASKVFDGRVVEFIRRQASLDIDDRTMKAILGFIGLRCFSADDGLYREWQYNKAYLTHIELLDQSSKAFPELQKMNDQLKLSKTPTIARAGDNFIRRHPQYEEVLYPRDRRDQRAAEEEKQEEESNIDEHEQLIVSAEQPKLRAFQRQHMHDIAKEIDKPTEPYYESEALPAISHHHRARVAANLVSMTHGNTAIWRHSGVPGSCLTLQDERWVTWMRQLCLQLPIDSTPSNRIEHNDPIKCNCGELISLNPYHAYVCPKTKGHRQMVHDKVRDRFHKLFKELNGVFRIEAEPKVRDINDRASESDTGLLPSGDAGEKRLDLFLQGRDGIFIGIDFAITSPQTKLVQDSQQYMLKGEATTQERKRKIAKYQDTIRRNVKFMPIVMEPSGLMEKHAWRWIKEATHSWDEKNGTRLLRQCMDDVAGILADEFSYYILEMRKRAAEICKEYRHGRAMEEVYSDEEIEERNRQMEQIVYNVLEENVQIEEHVPLGRD